MTGTAAADERPRARRVIVLVAALAMTALTVRLGIWQLDRAHQKLALQSSLDERAALPPIDDAGLARRAEQVEPQVQRRAVLRGQWVADRTVWLDNRPMEGRPGFFVVTPLRLAGRPEAVLVQRGWVPVDPSDRQRVPPIVTPPGEVRIEGLIAPSPSRAYQIGDAGRGAIRQNLDIDAFARESGLALLPLTVLQTAPADDADGLRRHWPPPAVDIHKHYGYALQWFLLAALTVALYVWFQLLRPRLRRAE